MAGAAKTGIVTSQWLQTQGVSRATIGRRENVGQLDRMSRGVYLVPSLRRPDSPLHAALVALPESAVGFESAAVRYRFPIRSMRLVVVQRDCTRLRIPGVTILRNRSFNLETTVTREGLRLTSPEQTLFDVARNTSGPRLSHLLETQFVAKLPTAEAFEQFVATHARHGVKGIAGLLQAMDHLLDDQPFPDSVLEKIMFDGLAQRGVRLTRQFTPPWYDGVRGIVDAAETIGRTIVEADGRRFRQVTAAHDNDRRRSLTAMSNDFAIVRASHQMMTREASQTFDQMAEIIIKRRDTATQKHAA